MLFYILKWYKFCSVPDFWESWWWCLDFNNGSLKRLQISWISSLLRLCGFYLLSGLLPFWSQALQGVSLQPGLHGVWVARNLIRGAWYWWQDKRRTYCFNKISIQSSVMAETIIVFLRIEQLSMLQLRDLSACQVERFSFSNFNFNKARCSE